ncbi:GNAT family N-acetyltransferase [Pedobacter sp. GR22-6]|uniref:GNAT family N-acetyltransferase n=1 Tax=Pedobacter sp. GR22-6 TaxID=3127957 RepID=UPI00307E2E31
MEPIEIKTASLNDIELLQQIGRQTFYETFAASNTEENMAKYLEDGFSIEKLGTELSNAGSEFHLAVFNNEVIGYLKINSGESQTELKEAQSLEIERIYVLKQFHGQKVGQLLYEKAIQRALEKKVAYVWLGVWEENTRAIRFYQKNGFVEFDKHIFRLGEEEQTDIMMKKQLNATLDLQAILENEHIALYPLSAHDFEMLYAAASDPEIWRQHPNKDRWKKEVFRNFFEGALQSKGAFRIVDKTSGKTIGSTRYYDHEPNDNSIFIGYTFYATSCWGKGINPAVKALMLDYIFQFVNKVYFHIGAGNIRSQIAILRLGAVKIDEQEVTYFGESAKLNFVYEIQRDQWQQRKPVHC